MSRRSLTVYKVALSLPINHFHKKNYIKKLAYIYYDKCFLWRNLYWVWKKKQHNLGFPFFKLPQVLNIFY